MNNSAPANHATTTSVCPYHRRLQPTDTLIFPAHKSTTVQYQTDDDGTQALYLFYADKEISFDEPELFSFGENLPKQAEFMAETATHWGIELEWARVQELLQQLLAEGILHYADSYLEIACAPEGNQPSPLPPALSTEPRTWFEAEQLSQEFTGHTLELGYLELVIPMFRIAHPMLDSEGRQVGEANVFPKQLRLDIATNWRTCIYPGSRYLDPRPMNVTALKSMRSYWPQIMRALQVIRNAYLQRYPRQGTAWSVCGLETLASLVLAVPTYQLLRHPARVANGALHPALASMFRVTDGLRVVLRQMVFVPLGEATISPHKTITAQEIFDYAERNFAFASEHGVCAGPKVMIDEFLNLLVHGTLPKNLEDAPLDTEVREALAAIDSAFTYGLYGLQIHTVVSGYWPLLAKTYIKLAAIVDAWNGAQTPALHEFGRRLHAAVGTLTNKTLHATDEWRHNREQAYEAMYQYYAQGLGLTTEQQSLTFALAQAKDPQQAAAQQALQNLMHAQLGSASSTTTSSASELVQCLMEYCVATQTLVRLACSLQPNINQLLGRAAPQQAFAAASIDILSLLQTNWLKRLPTIIEEVEAVFGVRIDISNERISVTTVAPTPAQ